VADADERSALVARGWAPDRGVARQLRTLQPTSADGVSLLSLRVAYIRSSEEARETAAARQRALDKAQEALRRVKRGLGGRYYKTRRQVDVAGFGHLLVRADRWGSEANHRVAAHRSSFSDGERRPWRVAARFPANSDATPLSSVGERAGSTRGRRRLSGDRGGTETG
jgi:hypothetical protein